MTELAVLTPAAAALVTEEFRSAPTSVDCSPFRRPFGRRIDLDDVEFLIEQAQELFATRPNASDAWLAPRLHYALRLTRREAGERGLWLYLGLCAFPEYVRWRWSSEESVARIERFTGARSNQAFARLWWMAELFRNGGDYSDVDAAMRIGAMWNTAIRLDSFHHRPLALASVKLLARANSGDIVTDDQGNAYIRALRVMLSAMALDIVPDERDGYSEAVREWIDETPRVADYLDSLPPGPDEAAVPADRIEAATAIAVRIAAQVHLPRV